MKAKLVLPTVQVLVAAAGAFGQDRGIRLDGQRAGKYLSLAPGPSRRAGPGASLPATYGLLLSGLVDAGLVGEGSPISCILILSPACLAHS